MQILRHESNFMWAEFKLVLELAQDSFWFWDACKHAHGTTMNHIAMHHRQSHEKYFRVKDARDAAQWTRVLTLPEAVGKSNLRGN